MTTVDIEKEVAAMTKICKAGNPNIVQILGHSWFGNWCFIDMELCALNLHDYIYARSNYADHVFEPIFIIDSSSAHLELTNIWTIVDHIAQGLKFVHENGFVHRDLKPQNSNFINDVTNDSTLFKQ